MKKHRIKYMDMVKGFGILLMIMGHVEFGNYAEQLIYAFHMPLFFFVSGFFFDIDKETTLQYAKRKAKQLIIPYCAFSIINTVVWIVVFGFQKDVLMHRIISILFYQNSNNYPIPIAGSLWFLIAMFVAQMECYIVIRKWNKQISGVIIIGLALFATISSRIIPFDLPFMFFQGFVGAAFIYLAYTFKEKWRTIIDWLSKHMIILILLGLVAAISALTYEPINMRGNWYGAYPIRWWFNALGAIVFWIVLMKKWDMSCKGHKLKNILLEIGKNSITYLALNEMFMLFFQLFWPVPEIGIDYVRSFIETIFILIAIYFVNWMIYKMKLTVIIGK